MGVQFRGSIPGLLVPLSTLHSRPCGTKIHDSGSVWIATPSLHETFIHNTLPAFTGALNFEPGTLNFSVRVTFRS